MDPFLAEIRIFPYSFAPKGWAFCNGQLIGISQNTALFALLGTYYGGDGRTNFALPNLQGAVPVNAGQSTGGTQWVLGETQGSNTVTLLPTQMPMHNHGLIVTSSVATQTGAGGAQLGNGFVGSLRASTIARMYSTNAPNSPLAGQSINVTGNTQPHNNMMPFQAFNYCIALQGIFPPRS